MGFSWSLYFMQVIGEKAMEEIGELPPDRRMSDLNPRLTLSAGEEDGAHYVYADNIGAFSMGSLAELVVTRCVEAAQLKLHSLGLDTHEVTEADTHGDALGVTLDGLRHCCELTEERFRKIRGALTAFLKRRKVSGAALEVLVGHCTFIALSCR